MSQFSSKNSTIEKKKKNPSKIFRHPILDKNHFTFCPTFFAIRKLLFSLLFLVRKIISQNKIKYPVLTLLMTILHNSSQDEMIPGRAGTVIAQRRRLTPSTVATGGGIAGGTTTTMTLALASASASALALTAAVTMAIARRPFTQEVEDRGAKPPVTTMSRVLRDNYE